ncbi:hypothetical protein AB0L64_32150 [Kribbella sp. NPDC051936]|uniref:hypothetical protein n=1 Tax=Kribbella sp. NPDC051936 TaxID=3154946 RepID=UPI0034350CBF
MGEHREEDPVAEWMALAGWAAIFDESDDLGLIAGGPPPSPGPPAIATAPMIIDTDLGGDPDDTVALVVAARRCRSCGWW